MSVLVLGEAQRRDLAGLRERAAARPFTIEGLIAELATEAGRRRHTVRMRGFSVAVPVGYLVSYTIETGHPCGACRHLAVSVAAGGAEPAPAPVWLLAEALGFSGGLRACTGYLENLPRRGKTVHLLQAVGTGGAASIDAPPAGSA